MDTKEMEISNERELMLAAFIAAYGEPGRNIDSETWRSWLGVFVIGWNAGKMAQALNVLDSANRGKIRTRTLQKQ